MALPADGAGPGGSLANSGTRPEPFQLHVSQPRKLAKLSAPAPFSLSLPSCLAEAVAAGESWSGGASSAAAAAAAAAEAAAAAAAAEGTGGCDSGAASQPPGCRPKPDGDSLQPGDWLTALEGTLGAHNATAALSPTKQQPAPSDVRWLTFEKGTAAGGCAVVGTAAAAEGAGRVGRAGGRAGGRAEPAPCGSENRNDASRNRQGSPPPARAVAKRAAASAAAVAAAPSGFATWLGLTPTKAKAKAPAQKPALARSGSSPVIDTDFYGYGY